jgi:hypothetical protein
VPEEAEAFEEKERENFMGFTGAVQGFEDFLSEMKELLLGTSLGERPHEKRGDDARSGKIFRMGFESEEIFFGRYFSKIPAGIMLRTSLFDIEMSKIEKIEVESSVARDFFHAFRDDRRDTVFFRKNGDETVKIACGFSIENDAKNFSVNHENRDFLRIW